MMEDDTDDSDEAIPRGRTRRRVVVGSDPL